MKTRNNRFSREQVWSRMKGEWKTQPGGALTFDGRKRSRWRWRRNGWVVEGENCVVDPRRSEF